MRRHSLADRAGRGYFTLNARCLDDVDVFELEIERFDGRSLMPGGEVPPLEG